MSSFEVWRRHLWLWVVPVGFCVLNLLAYSIYRSAFADKVERLERRYQQATDQLAASEQERQLIEAFLAKVASQRAQVDGLYGGHFQTESQRFTRVLQEIKSLAERAGLEPTTLSYPRKVYGEHGLVRRSIRFSVNGRYEQLRKFINFLELTDHFIALESVTLGDTQERNLLGINLQLSTFFSLREISSQEIAAQPAIEQAVPPGAVPPGAVPPGAVPAGEEPTT